MSPRNKVRLPSVIPWISCLLWSVLVTGCALQPAVDRDGKLAWERHQESYRGWSLTPRYWKVTGTMDLETPETGGRRHRVMVTGRGWSQGKMVVLGPFQQTVGELWMDDQYIRMIDPQRREIHQALANEEGLQRLARVRLSPVRLLQVVLGVAIPPDPARMGSGDDWISADGDSIQLDPQGRVVARSGKTGSQESYRVAYQWGIARDAMPVKVQLTMGENHHLGFEWKEWHFPQAAVGEEMLRFNTPEGFQWMPMLGLAEHHE